MKTLISALGVSLIMMLYACNQSSTGSKKAASGATQNEAASIQMAIEAGAVLALTEEIGLNSAISAQLEASDLDEGVKAMADELFAQVDANKNGAIDAEEMQVFGQDRLPIIMKAADTNGDGKIDATDLDALKAKIVARIQKAKEAAASAAGAAPAVDVAAPVEPAKQLSEVCAQLQQRLAQLGELAARRPMFDRVIAKCEAGEVVQGPLPAEGKTPHVCANIEQMIQRLPATSQGLKVLAQKCKDGTFGRAPALHINKLGPEDGVGAALPDLSKLPAAQPPAPAGEEPEAAEEPVAPVDRPHFDGGALPVDPANILSRLKQQ
jgi:hypothetical protein